MNDRIIEVSAIVLASLVAAGSSIVGLFTLWAIQAQGESSELQLAEIQKQSDILQAQLGVNESLISNDSALTFLRLLETMKPRWTLEEIEVGLGGDEKFEEYDDNTIVAGVKINNVGQLPLVVSRHTTIGVYSCLTGKQIDLNRNRNAESTSGDTDGRSVLIDRILSRTLTIPINDSRTVDFSKDILEEAKLVDEFFGASGEFLITHSALVYAEGAETLTGFVGDIAELESYFKPIIFQGTEARAPFLAATIQFDSWLVSDGTTVQHNLTTENCSWNTLAERFERSNSE